MSAVAAADKASFVQKSSGWVRKPKKTDANLPDYFKACKTFRWKSVEKEFDWHRTKKVNLVHEAVDRHAAGARKNKVALYFWDPTHSAAFPSGRDEKYTFLDLRRASSRFGNVLKKYGIGRGDRVAVFLPRTPELYIVMLGIHRVGAVPPGEQRGLRGRNRARTSFKDPVRQAARPSPRDPRRGGCRRARGRPPGHRQGGHLL
jgi:hypothetical protein